MSGVSKIDFEGDAVVTDDALNDRTVVELSGLVPSGPAGGDLAGTFPDPTLSQESPRLPIKAPCRLATAPDTNIDIASAPSGSPSFSSPYGAVTPTNGDRILLTGQTAAAENGIYIFNGGGSALTRATDADSSAEMQPFMVKVLEGTTTALWFHDVVGVVLETTSIPFYATGTAGIAIPLAASGAGSAGSSLLYARQDHVHPAETDPLAIQKALIDAKGDLIVGSAADTAVRRAVGTDGQVLTADSAQSDGVKWATPSAVAAAFRGFSAFRATSVQSINSGVATKVALTGEEWDTGSEFDSATNYRHTPTVAGKWRYTAQAYFDGSAFLADANFIYAALYKNGVQVARNLQRIRSTSNGGHSIEVVRTLDLNGTTDYVEFFVAHDKGSAVDLYFGSEFTYLQGELVGA